MKTVKYFVLFVFIGALVSCSSDDDSPSYQFTKDNLSGKYHLTAFQSKKVTTLNVQGFDVTTTEKSEGDTFSYTYEFSSNDQVTKNGTYRISKTKKQNGHTSDTTFIVNSQNLKVDYSIDTDQKTLTIDGLTYKVSNWSQNGMKLKAHKEETLQNGTSEYTESLTLEK